jgi:hypothetical protein
MILYCWVNGSQCFEETQYTQALQEEQLTKDKWRRYIHMVCWVSGWLRRLASQLWRHGSGKGFIHCLDKVDKCRPSTSNQPTGWQVQNWWYDTHSVPSTKWPSIAVGSIISHYAAMISMTLLQAAHRQYAPLHMKGLGLNKGTCKGEKNVWAAQSVHQRNMWCITVRVSKQTKLQF